MTNQFTPTVLFVGDNIDDQFEVAEFSMNLRRDVSDDGSSISDIHGGTIRCKIFLENEGNSNAFFASWLADPSKRQTVVVELHRLVDQSHYTSVRILNAALVEYVMTREKDDQSRSLLFVSFSGFSFTVGPTNIVLNF